MKCLFISFTHFPIGSFSLLVCRLRIHCIKCCHLFSQPVTSFYQHVCYLCLTEVSVSYKQVCNRFLHWLLSAFAEHAVWVSHRVWGPEMHQRTTAPTLTPLLLYWELRRARQRGAKYTSKICSKRNATWGWGGHVVGAGWLLLAGAAAAEPTAAGGDGKAGVGGRAVEGLAGYFKGWLPPRVRWGATAGAGTEWST